MHRHVLSVSYGSAAPLRTRHCESYQGACIDTQGVEQSEWDSSSSCTAAAETYAFGEHTAGESGSSCKRGANRWGANSLLDFIAFGEPADGTAEWVKPSSPHRSTSAGDIW